MAWNRCPEAEVKVFTFWSLLTLGYPVDKACVSGEVVRGVHVSLQQNTRVYVFHTYVGPTRDTCELHPCEINQVYSTEAIICLGNFKSGNKP